MFKNYWKGFSHELDEITSNISFVKNKNKITYFDLRYNFLKTDEVFKYVITLLELFPECKIINLSNNCLTRTKKNKLKFNKIYKELCSKVDYIDITYTPLASHPNTRLIIFLEYNDLLYKTIFIPEIIITYIQNSSTNHNYMGYIARLKKLFGQHLIKRLVENHLKYYRKHGVK